MPSTTGRTASTALGVKALLTRARNRVWSGGSRKTIIVLSSWANGPTVPRDDSTSSSMIAARLELMAGWRASVVQASQVTTARPPRGQGWTGPSSRSRA